ncbi:MAG: hypothetical protein HPY83_19115 [Anaerolineae bacterium]|nr:hypothetical protein [Anaerolineae bacterium]
MNPVIEAIKGRRSVRSFLDKPVPRELIETIIDAGRWAPTGANMQLWRFVVVEDAAFRARLLDAARPNYRRFVTTHWAACTDEWFREQIRHHGEHSFGWPVLQFDEAVARFADLPDGVYFGAPVVIFVIGTVASFGTQAADCYMACQNMMLAAHSLGLGTCIVGFGAHVTNDPGIVEALELKEGERIFGPVVVGYPQIVPEAPEKKLPLVKWI